MNSFNIMKNFVDYVDKELLPAIKKKLFEAFSRGHNEYRTDDYIKLYHLEGRVVDFGLPSGTKWIVRNGRKMTFREAKNYGLQLPSEDQIQELIKCKWSYVHGDAWHGHVLGPNGYETGVFDSYHNNLCLWPNDAQEDENFMVMGYVYKNGDERPQKSSVYVGERFESLFVIPNII